MTNALLYLEIDFFAIVVLLIINGIGRTGLKSTSQKLFQMLTISAIIVLLFDGLGWLLDGKTFAEAMELNIIVNYCYWFATLLPCYFGLLYCTCEVSEKLYYKCRIIYLFPIICGAVFLLFNNWSNWIFMINDHNVYVRGTYFLAVGILPYIHMVAAEIMLIVTYRKSEDYDKGRYAMLGLFMAFPAIGSVVQILYYGVPGIWVGLTISILTCYVYIQNGNISTDPMTKLNNRRTFDAYMLRKKKHLQTGEKLHLIIIDLNQFKQINDVYGHAEGDRALIMAANAILRVCNLYDVFAARLGGDEFAVVVTGREENAVENVIKDICYELDTENRNNEKNYVLSFSTGYASLVGGDETTIKELFYQADKKMYENKNDTKS